MDEIIKLIQNNECEIKTLGEIGYFYAGLSGKSKNDFNNGNYKYITYENIYNNKEIKIDNINNYVQIKKDENQNKVIYGDILFTASSETKQDCGEMSVVNEEIKEDVYLNSFSFGFRLYDLDRYDLNYLKHIFRIFKVRKSIMSTASGVTRYNISKDLMKKVKIPIPSLENQKLFSKTLDKFEKMSTELQAELQKRINQYNYCNNYLLDIEKDIFSNLVQIKLSDFAYVDSAGVDKKINEKEKEILLLNYMDVYKNRYINNEIPKMLVTASDKKIDSCNILKGDILITPSSETKEDIFRSSVAVEDLSNTVYSYHIARIRLKQPNYITSCYLSYLFQSEKYRKTIYKFVNGNTRKTISKSDIENLNIYIPSIALQKDIVNILDKFTAYIDDAKGLLPKEIELRKKHYEYYREKLLTFDVICGSRAEQSRADTIKY